MHIKNSGNSLEIKNKYAQSSSKNGSVGELLQEREMPQIRKKKLKNSNVKPTVIRVIDWVSCRISNNRFTVLAVETFKLASLIKRTSNVQERLST